MEIRFLGGVMPFGITTPASQLEHREILICEDVCPECGGELDTGWQCNSCEFDAHPEARKIDIDKYHRDNLD